MAIHKLKIFAGSGSHELAAKIAESYGCELGDLSVSRFSDAMRFWLMSFVCAGSGVGNVPFASPTAICVRLSLVPSAAAFASRAAP